MLVGLDLSPGLSFIDAGAYFPGWSDSPPDARALWRLVDDASADDPHLGVAGFLRHAEARRHFRRHGDRGDLFPGGRGRLRVCEEAQRAMRLSPSSCFNLIGAAQVGKSSLTGMRVLHRLNGAIPVWPIDPLPPAGPVIVEIYPRLAALAARVPGGRKLREPVALAQAVDRLGSPAPEPVTRFTDHAGDALLTAAWMRTVADRSDLWTVRDPDIARTEGWTFGVPWR